MICEREPVDGARDPESAVMHTHNETTAHAPLETCFRVGADVERWPEILPHYREVRFLRRDGFGHGRVRMAAYRDFGRLRWPTWWESEMAAEPEERAIHYRHVGGITRRMRVAWRFEPRGDHTRIVIVHDWEGPRWPGIGRFAARAVIGPRFVHAIAARTRAGVRREAERLARAAGGEPEPSFPAREPAAAAGRARSSGRAGTWPEATGG